RKGIDADKFFGRQIFAGSHDTLVLAVLNGTVDAGATFANGPEEKMGGSWTAFLKSPEDQKKIRVLYVTEPYTGDNLATSKKFMTANKALVDQMTQILGDMGKNAEGQKILHALYHIDSMIPAKSEDYDSVRAAARTLKIIP